jgi:hypothetical protein
MWFTAIRSFSSFKRGLRDPESIYLSGILRGTPRTLTLSTVMEEADHIFVRGNGTWAAQIWREGKRLKAAPR